MAKKDNTSSKYAGQRKRDKDIDRKLKAEKGRAKSNAKKAEVKKTQYYAKLALKNKRSKDNG